MSCYGTASSNVIAASLLAVANQEARYKDGMRQNHALCKSAAARLAVNRGGGGGEIEKALRAIDTAEEDNGSTDAWLKEQRERVKRLAELNVENERLVTSFVMAANALREQVLHPKGGPAAEGENEEEEELPDYERTLQALVQEKLASDKASQVTMEQESMYREICSELGEKMPKAKKSRRSGGSAAASAGGDDDDDDIEVFRGNGTQSLKCPLSGNFLENPVKNKPCGHMYSKEHILEYINSRRRNGKTCPCPIPGCSSMVSVQQLEQDLMAETMVRREKRRQDQASQHRATQASMVDSEDEAEFA